MGGVHLLMVCAWVVGFLTRTALLVKAAPDVNWNVSLLGAFVCGALFDAVSAICWFTPIAVILAFLPINFFARWYGRVVGLVLIFAGLYAVGFTAMAEWFFWDEFGTRFNFIAIDYLVYTTEVLGNIRESYPMPLLLSSLFALVLAIELCFVRLGWIRTWFATSAEALRPRLRSAALWVAVMVVVLVGLNERYIPDFGNNYTRELAKSGPWSFVAAFRANQLDYDLFYPTMPTDAAFKRVRASLLRDGSQSLAKDAHDLTRHVTASGAEQRLNVIHITVESLSASFFSRYGSKEGITPHLDALMPECLVFDHLYATGNRTDRGMEALTLSVPPTPGRSLVKRPENEHLFTLGSVFRSKGYETAFIYGGYGYFDNMNYFFGENGYRVVDRTKVPSGDITFANVWGACDEDLFRWTLREADRDFAAGKPFYHFVMTTSNHRPFTFPAGRIDLESKVSGRAGGVKYTDYAIANFIEQAATHPWFRNTVFVIVADHCGSSAGKTELPVQNYHIPMMIYAPGGQLPKGNVSTLMSQIDFAPTLLGLLNWSYDSRFFGRDVLKAGADGEGRAFIANYQKLGLLKADSLAVLKPIRESLFFSYNRENNALTLKEADPVMIDDAIAYYQTASYLFKHHLQGEISSATAPSRP